MPDQNIVLQDFKLHLSKRELPLFKSSITDLLKVLSDKDRTPEKIKEKIESDPILFCRVLKLVNSSMYAPFGKAIVDLPRAINILGENAICTLLTQLPPLKDSLLEEEIAIKTEYFKSAASTNLTKKVVAHKKIEPTDTDIAYCYLERYGYVALANYLPEIWSQIKVHAQKNTQSIEQSMAVFGVDPQDLKQCVFEQLLNPDTANEDIKNISSQCSILVNHVFENTESDSLIEDFAQALGVTSSFIQTSLKEVKQEVMQVFKVDSISVTGSDPNLNTSILLTRGLSNLRLNFDNLDIIKFSSSALDLLHAGLLCSNSVLYLVSKDEVKAVYGKTKAGKMTQLNHLRFKRAESPTNTFEVCLFKNSIIKLNDPKKVRNPQLWDAHFSTAKEVKLIPIAMQGKAIGLLYLDWEDKYTSQDLDANRKIDELIHQYMLVLNKKMEKTVKA